MGQAATRHGTHNDFLDWEARQPERYEFVDGTVRMMVWGTRAHNRIAGNVFSALNGRLAGSGCEAFTQAMKLKAGESVVYPDVFVSCSRADDDALALEDAVLVVEVLSPSTEQWDRTGKWSLFQRLPSLRYYVTIRPDRPELDLFAREGDGWRPLRVSGSDAMLVMPGLDLELPLSAIYAGTAVA